jgi:hypothetical protein
MKATTYIKKFAVVAAVTALAVGAMAGAAFASGPGAGEANLTGTEAPAVTLWTPGGFATTLTGHADVLLADATHGAAFSGFTVTDATGTGDGWTVTVAATRFTAGEKQLDADSLAMPVYEAQGNVGNSGGVDIADENFTEGYATVDNASGVELASAGADDGMGIYTFSTSNPWKLSIPTAVYAGNYTSSITVTVAQPLD